MAWTSETFGLTAQLRDHLARVLDGHTRAQVAAWVAAWDSLAPEVEAALTEIVLGAVDGRVRRNDVIASQRLLNALELVEGRLDELVQGSAASIIAELGDVVDYAGSLQQRVIASQLPASAVGDVAGWSRVSTTAIDAIVLRTTEQITKLSYPLADEAAAAMRRELVRGIAVGANPRAVAGRMVDRTEGLFNGGLGRALTIARTEMLDAHRAATALADQANADLLTGWVWVSALSTRTCPACFAKHGTLHPLDQPGPEGHQNCRCTRVPKTKTWRELGFDIDEPEDLLPDARTVFDSFTPQQQRDILGPARFQAWQDGRFPMDDWAVKRSTDGWRDSWTPAPAPAA